MASSSFAGFSGGIKGTKKKKKINVQEEEEEKDGEKREAVLAVGKDRVHLKEEKKKGEEKKVLQAKPTIVSTLFQSFLDTQRVNLRRVLAKPMKSISDKRSRPGAGSWMVRVSLLDCAIIGDRFQ